MRKYLLDTNIISDAVRDASGHAATRIIRAGGSSTVYTSVIVAAELRFGLAKRRSFKLAAQLEVILSEMVVAAFAAPADRIYADLRATLERAGTPIGANDLWIAAQALHDGSILVTDNVDEFRRVPGLEVENWLR